MKRSKVSFVNTESPVTALILFGKNCNLLSEPTSTTIVADWMRVTRAAKITMKVKISLFIF